MGTEYDFMAEVIGYDKAKGGIWVEQRNRFAIGDCLEILSATREYLNKNIIIEVMENVDGEAVADAKLVQQKVIAIIKTCGVISVCCLCKFFLQIFGNFLTFLHQINSCSVSIDCYW